MMPAHPEGLNRLFWAMTIVLFAGLFGMGCMELFLVRPLRRSITDGVVGSNIPRVAAQIEVQ